MNVSVVINNDGMDEMNKDFSAVLTTSNSMVILDPDTANITILDDGIVTLL